MTKTVVQPGQQPVDLLRLVCERCIASLNALTAIHLEMDRPDRTIQPSDEACVYRLRKILLHVQAVTCWQIDTDIMHVWGPEIRAANDQIDTVFREMPRDYRADHFGSADEQRSEMQRLAKTRQERVSSYIHPTPQRLLLPKELGGLGKEEASRYYANMFVLLGDLVLKYGVSLGYLSHVLNGERAAAIASVLKNNSSEWQSVLSGDCFKAVP